MNYKVHETAILDDGAQIGDGSKIWHWVHVCGDAKIGLNVTLGQNVFVGNNAIIGNNCKIQNNVSIFDSVHLEDNVFCGPSVVFTNVYNPRSQFVRNNQYRKTLIQKGATLGANATILCGITIGEFAFIGAGSLVNKNVPAFALVVGVPAKQIGWMSKYGEKLDLPISGVAEAICKNTGQKYQLQGSLVSIIN
jgi:UDP-2-acetamido-3-amino-2,3-dideoxy-glucuronate N-acetyltransferase